MQKVFGNVLFSDVLPSGFPEQTWVPEGLLFRQSLVTVFRYISTRPKQDNFAKIVLLKGTIAVLSHEAGLYDM